MTNGNPRGKQGHARFEAKVQKILAGLEKYLAADTTLGINGTTVTVAEIEASFSAYLAKLEAIRSAKAQWQQAIAAAHDAAPAERRRYVALRKVLEGNIGLGNPQLLEYGFSLGIPKPKTGETMVIAAAKARATRLLRHTMGSKQRLALSDAVTEPSVQVLAPDGKPLSVATTATPDGAAARVVGGRGALPGS